MPSLDLRLRSPLANPPSSAKQVGQKTFVSAPAAMMVNQGDDVGTYVTNVEKDLVALVKWCRRAHQPRVDQKWFVHIEPELQRDRVAGREVNKGIEKDMGGVYRRYNTGDGLNGKYIVENSLGVDIVIENSEEMNLKEMNGGHPT